MKKMKRKPLHVMAALFLILSLLLTGCSDTTETDQATESPSETASEVSSEDAATEGGQPEAAQGQESWAIYWYLCGSDLESGGGFATQDLEEMLQVKLPENVKVIIQSGGSKEWKNELMDPAYLERFVFDSNGLTKVSQEPSASMGSPDTLSSFLRFAATDYPADHEAVIFWNHGGGSVAGAASDELYGGDSLTLDEMDAAFGSVFAVDGESLALDMVGFDTCLMATVDTAKTFVPYAQYLVASQELEPGNGWNYDSWLGELAANTAMTGDQLGTAICDSYVTGCEEVGTKDEITLSVTDLTKLAPLLVAYDNIGKEALASACQDPTFFAEFARSAQSSENYGGNTRDQGFTNMVDLGHLVRNSSSILAENAETLLQTLADCVVYKVNGPYRAQSTGLSCYYSYNGDTDNFNGFSTVGASESFKHLYAYELTGELSEEGMTYVSDMGYEELPTIPTLESLGIDNYPLVVNEEGSAVLDLGADVANLLTGVYFQLYYVDTDTGIMLQLGRDNDIIADWENGVFKDNFRAVWGAIDGTLVYMELSEEGEDYNLYSIPIKLNGEECSLTVAWSEADGYTIIGARKAIDENGMGDRDFIELKVGDEITTIHYGMDVSEESTSDEMIAVDTETITVTEETSFGEIPLGDGKYIMMYEMLDISDAAAYSQTVVFTVTGEEITTELGE